MRITVKTKLGLAFATVIAMSGVTAWLGISNLASLNATMENLVAGPVERIQLAQELSSDLLLTIRTEKNLILEAANADARGRYDADLVKQRETLAARLDKIDSMATVEGKKQLATLKNTQQQWILINDKIRSQVRDNQVAEALALSTGAGREMVAQQEKQIGEYLELQKKIHGRRQGRRLPAVRDNPPRAAGRGRTGLLVGVIAAAWIAFSISRGLSRAGGLAQAVAAGDLTQTAISSSKDEIGDLVGHINTMVEKLRGVVTDASGASDNVSSGSQELSSSSQQLSQGATEQASAAEQASASMEQMAANIKQNADNASQTEKIARQSSLDAQKSGEAVGRAVRPCRPSRKKSPSSRKSPARPICSPSTPPSRQPAPANTAGASPSSPPRSAGSPNAARPPRPKSARCPRRPSRPPRTPAKCSPALSPTSRRPPNW